MTDSGPQRHYAILFADITGSTALYEKLGDSVAQAQIGLRLDKIASVVHGFSGKVIKTIGDEVMCSFEDPAAAVHASREIHEVMDRQTDASGLRLSVRIGVHFGSAILKDNDLFGDAVNVAARVAGLAKGQQTLTTAQTVAALEPANQGMIRLLSQTPVKGKTEALILHEVIWRQENLTVLSTSRTQTSGAASERIVLNYQNRIIAVDGKAGAPFTLGRDDSCKLQVKSTLASRQHGKIEHRMGKFVYVDHSANGSYINLPEINNLFLHREEIPLFGSGVLSCGEKVQDGNAHLVHFSCE
jgi:class 3 adenylate cyclase